MFYFYLSSFVELTSFTFNNVVIKERRVLLLMIKCLYEMQECGIIKLAASKVDGGGDGGCSLMNFDIAPVDCAGLFLFLSHVKNLQRLFLACNHIACLELAKFLTENDDVFQLGLSENNITDEGVKHLCDALKNENCKLTNLDITKNNINDEGVKHLCDALKNENCKLTDLNLCYNKINDEGVKQLCDALKNENCKLTNLSLQCIMIKDQCVEHLYDAAKVHNIKL